MIVVDLTHEMKETMSLFPGAKLYELEQTAKISEDGYVEHKLTLTTHLGTHMDSPSHILHGGKRLCEYPVSQFIGSGLVIDVSKFDGLISKDYLCRYENIEEAEFILLYTGHDVYYGTSEYLKSFPVLDESGVLYIKELAEHKLKGIGIDTLSIDPVEPVSIERHKIILGANLLIIENLTNLSQLIDKDFLFQALPLKLEKVEGSPVRAIALIDFV